MKRANPLMTLLGAMVCVLGAVHWFHATHAYAQQNNQSYDDGSVDIYAYIDVDSNYYLYTQSYAGWDVGAADSDDFVDDEIQVDEDHGVFYDDFAAYSNNRSTYPQLQFNPVAPGHEYGVSSIGWICIDYTEESGCTWQQETPPVPASVNVAAPPPPPPPPPPDPCAVTSNPQAGFTSIVSTGTAGGAGTMAVSFSGTAYAAISPSVTYGPYSTPSSIASSIAALITRSYLQYGLSAKAFGSNIVYSGVTTLGAVSNAATGPSFTTDASSTAATQAGMACMLAPPPPPAGLSCKSVTRGQSTTCVANGGAVSNWSFTDGTNTVTRTANPTSPTWGGVMATGGTVSVTVAGAQKTATITVNPRTGWAFTAAAAVQQSNPYTDSCSNVLSVNNPPMAPGAGATETLGFSGLCPGSSFADLAILAGPNSGYAFFTSAANGTQFNWVGAQDALNPSSVFYGKQCGNYNPGTNVGFISGANLSVNLVRHESSAISGQGHYGNYVATQNSPSLNVGIAYEPIVVFGDNRALEASAKGPVGSNQSAITAAMQVEPPQPQYNGLGVYLGDINYPPYATCP